MWTTKYKSILECYKGQASITVSYHMIEVSHVTPGGFRTRIGQLWDGKMSITILQLAANDAKYNWMKQNHKR